jgi:hypothetical protein
MSLSALNFILAQLSFTFSPDSLLMTSYQPNLINDVLTGINVKIEIPLNKIKTFFTLKPVFSSTGFFSHTLTSSKMNEINDIDIPFAGTNNYIGKAKLLDLDKMSGSGRFPVVTPDSCDMIDVYIKNLARTLLNSSNLDKDFKGVEPYKEAIFQELELAFRDKWNIIATANPYITGGANNKRNSDNFYNLDETDDNNISARIVNTMLNQGNEARFESRAVLGMSDTSETCPVPFIVGDTISFSVTINLTQAQIDIFPSNNPPEVDRTYSFIVQVVIV